MNAPVIPIVPAPAAAPSRERRRQSPKGRRVDPAVRAEVRALLGDEPLRRDRLIEYLHALQDAQGQLGAPQLAALAELLRLAQAEVFEVATFYHHFDVVRDGEAPPHWAEAVDGALAAQAPALAALWQGRSNAFDNPGEAEALAAPLQPLLARCMQGTLAQLYPGAWPEAPNNPRP